MTIYAIVVNYYSSVLVGECVRSLKDEPVEIIVVNNSASEHESAQLALIAQASPAVRVVEAGENLGFGAGVNLGVKVANIVASDKVWLVNPDVLITDSGTADALAEVLDSGVGVASPAITTGAADDLSVWYAGGTYDSRRGVTIHWNDGDPVSVLTGRRAPEPVTFITGAAMMIRGDIWMQLQGFREDLFLYWEDSDFCIRASEMGVRMAVVPSVSVWHKVGATSAAAGKSAVYFYYMHRNRLIVSGRRGRSRLLFGSGSVWTARFIARAARSDRPIEKLGASLRGLRDGFLGAV
jgi:N-acetylglucosaminyl-diphospho-decaprenol L-rhamnosyltransferase